MDYPDKPPTYEESLKDNPYIEIYNNYPQHNLVRGPDKVYYGKYFMVADFIPWSEYTSNCEDMSYLLIRVNDWLAANCSFNVTKCEFVPRMIDSRKKLDLLKCYIFNLTFGQTYFVNQLRLSISINKLKTQPDYLCITSYIPEPVRKGNIDLNIPSGNYKFLIKNNLCQYEDLTTLITKINEDLYNGVISGVITNISMFYTVIGKHSNQHQRKDNTIYSIEASEPKYYLKSLRVFHKSGHNINGIIGVKTFSKMNNLDKMDQLLEDANQFVSNMPETFICMETFPEYEEESRFINKKYNIDFNSTVVIGERLIRLETIKVFYFIKGGTILKPIQSEYESLKILWIVPRKIKNVYENHNSFMDYIHNIIQLYDDCIIDMETLLIPNSLSWSEIRHQTLFRYQNEGCTNYQIYAIKLLIKSTTIPSLKNVSSPYK